MDMSRKEKRVEKNKKRKLILFSIIECIFVIALIYSGVKIYSWFMDNKKNGEVIGEVQHYVQVTQDDNNEKEYIVDFAALTEKNPDTIAYLIVNGTDISFPVVKTDNNDFYLRHNFYKEYNRAGWIFANYINKFDGTDKNISIFGHNMRNNSMFGTMNNMLTADWQNNDENITIVLATKDSVDYYRVFSVYKIEPEEYYLKNYFGSDEEYLKFLNTLKSRSVKNFGTELSAQSRILTLSTCTNDNKERIVLHAVKMP